LDYRLEIAEENIELQLTPADGDKAVATLGEQTRQLAMTRLADGSLALFVDGRPLRAYHAATAEGGWVHVAGRAYQVKDHDKAPARRKASADDGPGQVTPPMPAVVVRIACAVGDEVIKGQGLVVVSAMKMETTLAAPYPGKVTAVNCQVDGKVMPGDILVDIEPYAEEEA